MSDVGLRARPVLVTGGVLATTVTVWLVLSGLPFLDALLVSAFTAALPALSVAQLALLGHMRVERLAAYGSSMLSLVVIGGVAGVVGGRMGGPAALGFVALPWSALVSWTAGLLVAGLALVLVFHAAAVGVGYSESPILRQLLPRTSREKGVFAALSVAAGLGEETAYRGYLITALAPLTGVGWAAVISSGIFGVLHVYQGWLGIPRTALLGGLLAWGFLASGSLWPAILAHSAIDLIAGIVLGDRLVGPAPPSESASIDRVAPSA
jgi:membrane protease YdiL (CAAX protease family)